jgi:molybdenum ABC transporter ATP-binding protein
MNLRADFIKRYPGGPSIWATFELDLDRFGITVLFGPSGCGKTTVLRVLSGLVQPEQGSIFLDGQIWFQTDGTRFIEAAERQVGHVFQDSALFPHMTVAENVSYGLRKWPTRSRGKRVAEMLERVGVEAFANRRPSALSGGQKQRVALARALAPKPRMLLLDEPFASLDRPSAQLLRQELRTLLKAENIPALLVTHHRGDALTLGDRLLRMEKGRIVQDGRPEEVLTGLSSLDDLGAECVVRARCTGRVEGLLRLEAGSAVLYAPDPGDVQEHVHVCIRSEGVALERPGPGALSHRNTLASHVKDLISEGALTRVRLDCGFPLEALLTTWACHDLHLRSGDPIHAPVKAAAIRVIPVSS